MAGFIEILNPNDSETSACSGCLSPCEPHGSNLLDEMDRNTIHLCPNCLRKLQWNLKFDVRQRYRQLRDIYKRSRYDVLAGWMDRRLAKLEIR